MKISDINPHLRCAAEFLHVAEERALYVKDCRILYVKDGEGEIEIGGERLHLKQDSLFYCAGDTVYTVRAAAPIHLIALNFDLTQRARHYAFSLKKEEVGISKNKVPTDKCHIEDCAFLNTFLHLKNASEFQGELSSIMEEYHAEEDFAGECASALLKRFLILLHRKESGKDARARDAVAVAADYITAHYAEPIKNARLGELTGYHEYYLNRLFLARMGMSIHKYVLSLRLDEARKLLENTALPLSRIATAVGFGTCAHFTAYFKKEFGIPPSRYREAAKQKGADAPIHP